MPIIKNPTDFFCENRFIFMENDLLLQRGEHGAPLTAGDLPTEQQLRRCLEQQAASDWYTEPELNYSAVMLEKDSPVPAGCEAMPLRQFFWESKTVEQQQRAEPSVLGGLAARAHGFLRLRETYRHCPKCGTLLQVDSVQVAKVCPSCGRLDFPRIEPAVIVLVRRGAEILLVKSKTVRSSHYSCVAGFMEHGESAEQCAAREVREETGLEIQNIRYVGSQSWPFPDQLMLAFTAEYKSGTIQKQESEIEDAAWFSRDALPELPGAGSVAYNLIMGHFGNG